MSGYRSLAEVGAFIGLHIPGLTTVILKGRQPRKRTANGEGYRLAVSYEMSAHKTRDQEDLAEFNPVYFVYPKADGRYGTGFGWIELSNEEFFVWELKHGHLFSH